MTVTKTKDELKENFYLPLLESVFENLDKNYSDNFDYNRFRKENPLINNAKNLFLKIFNKITLKKPKRSFERIKPYLNDLNHFYQNLQDQQSRDLLLKLIEYRILGYKKLRLPQNNQSYWHNLKHLEKLANYKSSIKLKFMHWTLPKMDLSSIGYPLQIFQRPSGINTLFHMKQYEYHQNDINISVEKNDIVLDAGGCWGDTALYFAYIASPAGKVFTFEFIPSNLDVLKRNLDLNPDLKNTIEIIERPLWSDNGTSLFYSDNGPGSKVSFENIGDLKSKVSTTTIDYCVQRHMIKKVDFIKMDIEGAEPKALEGALETIRNFKPKLAISIYHNLDDFSSLYKIIENLDLGYRFYLGHSTIHAEETVLFAKVF